MFQDAQAELAHSFWGPALALAGAETLGQLVHHRREELRIATGEIEWLSHPHGWLGSKATARRTPGVAIRASPPQCACWVSPPAAPRAHPQWTIEAAGPAGSLARNALRAKPNRVWTSMSTSRCLASWRRAMSWILHISDPHLGDLSAGQVLDDEKDVFEHNPTSRPRSGCSGARSGLRRFVGEHGSPRW